MKRGIEPRDRTTAVCAGSLEKGFYSSYPRHAARLEQPLAQQIREVLLCDPRPAYRKGDDSREYGISLYGLNIRFRITAERIEVNAISEQKGQD